MKYMIESKVPPCEAFHNIDHRYYRHETEIVAPCRSFYLNIIANIIA